MSDPKGGLHPRARVVVAWAPSQWMMLVLAVWWSWRWASVPPQLEQAGLSVATGFLHDLLVLYGVFGLLRGRRISRPEEPLRGWALALTVLFAASSLLRAMDALQVHLTGARIDTSLARVLLADPIGELIGLRGLLLGVLLSAVVANFALRKDLALWGRLAKAGVGKGARIDVVAGAALLAGVMLSIGRGTDEASGSPEFMALSALWRVLAGGG